MKAGSHTQQELNTSVFFKRKSDTSSGLDLYEFVTRYMVCHFFSSRNGMLDFSQ